MCAFTAAALLGTMPAAADSKTNALIGQLGLGCKNRVIEQFDVPNSDITVRLGATLQESLDLPQKASAWFWASEIGDDEYVR